MDSVETNRYLLKEIETNDYMNIYEILSNKNVIQNLNMDIHTHINDSKLLIKEYLEGLKEKTKFPYRIIDKKTKKFMGVFLIKLDLYDKDCFEFTMFLNERYWGMGIYTEVLPYMIKEAFKTIKTKNFRGFVKENNIASRKVLSKSGFKLEKIFNVAGIEDNIYSFLITREEYFNGL